IQKVVDVLVAHGRAQRGAPAEREDLRQLRPAPARGSPMADLSLGDQLVHRAGDVGNRRLRVESMALIEVDRFEPQAPERMLDRLADPAAPEAVVRKVLPHRMEALGSDDALLT